MAARIQLKQTVYMQLDGQWQLVHSGSVIDVADSTKFSGDHATVLAETPGALANNLPTSVRSVRVR